MATTLTNLLPAKLRPFAKAIYPFIATIIGIIAVGLSTHQVDQATLATAITGLVLTAGTYFIPNLPAEAQKLEQEIEAAIPEVKSVEVIAAPVITAVKAEVEEHIPEVAQVEAKVKQVAESEVGHAVEAEVKKDLL